MLSTISQELYKASHPCSGLSRKCKRSRHRLICQRRTDQSARHTGSHFCHTGSHTDLCSIATTSLPPNSCTESLHISAQRICPMQAAQIWLGSCQNNNQHCQTTMSGRVARPLAPYWSASRRSWVNPWTDCTNCHENKPQLGAGCRSLDSTLYMCEQVCSSVQLGLTQLPTVKNGRTSSQPEPHIEYVTTANSHYYT